MSSIGPPPFKLERYLGMHEFTVKHQLSVSDAEGVAMTELLAMADEECRELWEHLTLGYTHSPGHPLLRHEVAALYDGVTADDVLEVVPQEGIFIAMKALASVAKQSDPSAKPHAIVTSPAYQSLYDNLRAYGCDVSFWTCKTLQTGWTFDIHELKALIQENTKILVVNFPHNPTGYKPTLTEWQEIVTLCKTQDLYLFSDEMYRWTDNDGVPPYPSACSVYDKSVTLCGLSKTFALPGLRVGWLCVKDAALLQLMAEFKDYLTICASAPSEILAIVALRNKHALIERTMAIVTSNLKCLDAFFAEFSDLFEWYRPKACTTAFVKLKGSLLELGEGGAQGFCDILREEVDVLMVPSTMFDFPDLFVRLGFGRKDMPQVVDVLAQFLRNRFRKLQSVTDIA